MRAYITETVFLYYISQQSQLHVLSTDHDLPRYEHTGL